MTAFGKILAFINLIFSFVVCGLMVVVYTTRTNWHNAAREGEKALAAMRAQYAAERETFAARQNDSDKRIKDLNEQLVAAQQRATDAETARRMSEAQLALATSTSTEKTDAEKRLSGELASIKEERKGLQERNTLLQTKIQELTSEAGTLRSKAVEAEVKFKAVNEKNQNLLALIEQKDRQLQTALKNQVAGAAPAVASLDPAARKAPTEEVRGTVTAVDPKYNLTTISIGSDAGLSRDHVLQVYRLSPSPTYVGTLTILSTRPHEAVGRFTGSQRKMVQIGDEVASKIVGTAAVSVNGGR